MRDIDSIMNAAPVIPVLVIDRVEDAIPIARALVEGGLPVLEVTLRTPAALDAIRAMKAVEGAIVGAGTVLNPEQLDQAVEAGAEVVVSPGLTRRLGEAAGGPPGPPPPRGRARRRRARRCRSSPASRRRARSCGRSTSASRGSNSFPPRPRAASPR